MYKLLGKWLGLFICIGFLIQPVAAHAASFTDIHGHWAKDAILWAVEEEIVNGYGDGTFLPQKNVTQAEFLAMLFRAYDMDVSPKKSTDKWDQAIWDQANELNWDLGDRYGIANRGRVAVIIGNALGYACSLEGNIQLLYDYGLSNGKTGKTIEGYRSQDALTRAEAVNFIQNAKVQLPDLKAKPLSSPPACPNVKQHAVTIGSYTVSSSVTDNSVIQLTASLPQDKGVLVRITSEKQEVKEVYTTVNKKLNTSIYLKDGAGKYKIEIYERSILENGSYTGVIWGSNAFSIENIDYRDMEYLLPTQYVQSDDPEVIALAERITKGLTTDDEKTKAIHDWVTTNIAYDTESYFNNTTRLYTTKEILERRKDVCSGYANVTAALNRAVGIKTKIITGTAIWTNVETWETTNKLNNHAWVETLIDGKWIIQDTTWDAGYISTDCECFTFSYSDDYFNPSDDFFKRSHRASYTTNH